MADYTDTTLSNFIISKISSEKYLELSAEGQLSSNEFYIIDSTNSLNAVSREYVNKSLTDLSTTIVSTEISGINFNVNSLSTNLSSLSSYTISSMNNISSEIPSRGNVSIEISSQISNYVSFEDLFKMMSNGFKIGGNTYKIVVEAIHDS